MQNFQHPLIARSEDVRVVPVIVSKLELGDIERKILSADLVERADDAALEDAPEALKSEIIVLGRRSEADKVKKQAQRSAADQFFKR